MKSFLVIFLCSVLTQQLIDAADATDTANPAKKPHKPLELCPINLEISNFTTNFNKLIDDLGRIQRENIPAYQRLLDNLDDNRRISNEAIVTANERMWRRIMYNIKLTADDKSQLQKELNATVSEATAGICNLIKAKQSEARELSDELDNSDLIANITTLLQNAIDAQEHAATQLVAMADTLRDEINSHYTKAEQVFIAIDAKLRSKN